jgi:hypothetical protein
MIIHRVLKHEEWLVRRTGREPESEIRERNSKQSEQWTWEMRVESDQSLP